MASVGSIVYNAPVDMADEVETSGQYPGVGLYCKMCKGYMLSQLMPTLIGKFVHEAARCVSWRLRACQGRSRIDVPVSLVGKPFDWRFVTVPFPASLAASLPLNR